jgi:hypothetical protein
MLAVQEDEKAATPHHGVVSWTMDDHDASSPWLMNFANKSIKAKMSLCPPLTRY